MDWASFLGVDGKVLYLDVRAIQGARDGGKVASSVVPEEWRKSENDDPLPEEVSASILLLAGGRDVSVIGSLEVVCNHIYQSLEQLDVLDTALRRK